MHVMARLEVKGHFIANSTFAREYLCLADECFNCMPVKLIRPSDTVLAVILAI